MPATRLVLARRPLGCASPFRSNSAPWLTDADLRRLSAFRRADDATVSLLASFLIAELAANALGCDPREIRLEREPSGRPFVARPSDHGLDVNATHAGDWAAAAAGPGRVGVDLEPVRAVSADLIARCLTARERAELHSLPEHQLHVRFFQLWTAKESYLKATGLGLALDPRALEIAIAGDGSPSLRNAAGDPDPGRWRLRTWQPEPGLWLTVCADRALPDRFELREAGW